MGQITLHQRLRPRQASVFACNKRFIIVVAGRRWGKTFLALWWLVTNAFSGTNRLCYFIAPNCRQAKRIAWALLKRLVPVEARSRTSEQELTIEVPNGSMIQLHGADDPDSLRGVGLDFVVLDEFACMNPEIWSMVVRPTLTDRKGRAFFISTPRSCSNHFYDLYISGKSRPDTATFRFRTDEGGYVAPEELAAVRSEMDRKRYAQEFEAALRAYRSESITHLTGIRTSPRSLLYQGLIS